LKKFTPEELAELIPQYFGILQKDQDALAWLLENQGIEYEEVVDKLIGWDAANEEFWFPVRDEAGKYIDIETFKKNAPGQWTEALCSGYKEVSLTTSIGSENYNKLISFSGIVIGKELSPYTIPAAVKVICQEASIERKKCKGCPALTNKEEIPLKLSDEKDKELLVSMIASSDQQRNGFIRQRLGLPPYNNCRQVDFDLSKRISVEEIRLTTEVNYEREDSEYVIHKCYVFGTKMDTNQRYQCWGTTYHDPKSQHAIHIIKRAKSKQDNLSQWKIDGEVRERLSIFQAKDPQDPDSVREKLAHIHRDLAANITKMHKRENVIQAVDMVYHTPLHYKFMGQRVLKGWGECAIVGDTRTGKTETVKNLIHHYRCGEFVTSGENTTLAGLLGGLQQSHKGRFSLTWGKIPMNDKRIVIIDEADDLAEKGIMGHLSGLRSSGIAELVKVKQARTFARTRLIFIANPKRSQLSSYNYGVNVIKEIFGKSQDISRLDFVVFCSKDDVADTEINKQMSTDIPHIYTSELCHERIMFAWTRGEEDAIWADGSDHLVLDLSVRFGKKYDAAIPLVLSAEFRMKLSKLAYSIALQTFSIDETGTRPVIYPAHVRTAASWISEMYDNQVCGYYDFSIQRRADNELSDEYNLGVTIGDDQDTVHQLLLSNKMLLGDFEDIFNLDRQEARSKINKLRKHGAIRKEHHYYVKSPQFIRWLKKRRQQLMGDDIPF